MNDSPVYKSLFDAVEMIAHNPPLPGDRKVLCRCMQCIDDFYYRSRITAEQWETLKTILIDACA